jgi:CheY-like chemotaxis protein
MELSGAGIGKNTADVRILLADDDELSQTITSVMLRRYGYRVDVVENGMEAVKALYDARNGWLSSYDYHP